MHLVESTDTQTTLPNAEAESGGGPAHTRGSPWPQTRADSRLRAARIARHALNWKRHTIMTLTESSKADVFACLEHHKLPLAIHYELFGPSFDGWDYRFPDQIRRWFPRDYDRILRWVPEAEPEYLRLGVAKRHGQAKVDRPNVGA